jgi:hypothetical protein
MREALGGAVAGEEPRVALAAIYLRVVAVLLLAVGLVRAGQVVGITFDGKSFADLTPAWRAAATTLCLVDLFAAVGLWIGAAWGPVMWAVALAVEVSMYTFFSDLFGHYPARAFVHAGLFALFLLLGLVDWWRMRTE